MPTKKLPSAGPDIVAAELVPMKDIFPSATNPRKHFDENSIIDLAESMQPPVGLLQPITLRKKATGKGYEIVAGERRYRAAKLLKWEAISAMIRVISDEEMLEFQILENLQREDVSPMDEAQAFKSLLQKENIEWLATKIHKSKKYIIDRMKLNELVEEAQDLVSSGVLPLGHAVVISKLSYADQKVCLDKCIVKSYGVNDNESYCKTPLEDLKGFIEDTIMLDFDKAPFDKDDTLLYEAAGSCAACPKRTCNATLLFDDITKDDKCTDASCYKQKIDLHVAREKSKATETYGKVFSGEKSGYNSGEIKVQGVSVKFQTEPGKNTVPVVITKVDKYGHDKSSLGKTVYVDPGKFKKLKEQKEERKENGSFKGVTYEQRQLNELKADLPFILEIEKLIAIKENVVTEFYIQILSDLDETVLVAFAALTGILEIEPTPDAIINYGNNSEVDNIRTICKSIYDKYSPGQIATLYYLLSTVERREGSSWKGEYGFTWPEMMEILKPGSTPKKPSKKQTA